MTTLILKLSPAEAARIEGAGRCLHKSREQAAKTAIRLFVRSIAPQSAKKSVRK